jgi:8-oxo-dGTP pyrophosphatase MutT (NUDIX family)
VAGFFIRLNIAFRRIFWRLTRPVGASVRLILVHEGRVLLVRHTYGIGWLLPGGAADSGETLEDAARREAAEEVGARLGELNLEGIFTNFWEGKTDHIAVFSSRDVQVSGRPNLEIAGWDFFDPAHLPEDTLSGHRRRIYDYFSGNGHPLTGCW